jgi:predicted NBD/HSP70 family sugar kinase
VNSLLEKKLIVCNGTETNGKQKLGKTAYTFALNGKAPLFIGIDVEYSITTIVVVNQYNAIVRKTKVSTEGLDTIPVFCDLIYSIILNEFSDLREEFRGIGIGIPRWLFSEDNPFACMEDNFNKRFSLPVQCRENSVAFALLKKFEHFHEKDFITISIREGIGLGVVYKKALVSSDVPWFLQIGHLRIKDSDTQCICGKQGCFETMYNQTYFLKEYLQYKGLPFDYSKLRNDSPQLKRILSSFFKEASEGDITCKEIVSEYCQQIAILVAPIVIAFGIPSILITGNFGDSCDIFSQTLKYELEWKINASECNLEVVYTPLIREGFSRGASLITMNAYFQRT